MTVPVFQEYEPDPDCDCPGCVQHRRALAAGEHPAAHGCRRALVLLTTAGVVLGSGTAGAEPLAAPLPSTVVDHTLSATASGSAPTARTGNPVAAPAAARMERVTAARAGVAVRAPEPEDDHEQGDSGPLHGRPLPGPSSGTPGTAPLRKTTRTDIIDRAKRWASVKVPYSMQKYWSDGYRQDCSGYVSMVWNLPRNEWTGTLAKYGTRITRAELQPGDMLLFHNPSKPTKGSHVTIFGGWADHNHTKYTAYEQAKPHTRKRTTPMAYWNNSDRYIPYRYKGLTSLTPAEPITAAPYPGLSSFGPGSKNKYVTLLGQALIARGGKRFYSQGAGPRWGDADRRATQAFQRAQGWRGASADGVPGPRTWKVLMSGQGRDIPPAGAPGPGGVSAVAPPYPGREFFRPGRSSEHVTRLGRRLVAHGFGRYYGDGPGPVWGEADRRNVEAFQRAQGWRGTAADGYPGPETWRRLFAPVPDPAARAARARGPRA
ncbi:peptidoglycan-binding protein [Streptomyces sp. NPDC057638]|uniref:peptidoglycan-binding protein n=1 Tax=Streptomyces sp. NPDC057638 TaxID=3346190 RepID=UPI0036B459F3